MTEPISPAMRDFLIEHLDSQFVPFVRNLKAISDALARALRARRNKSRDAALRRGWVVRTLGGNFTVITESGRYVLAAALADWADAITRSQLAAESRPISAAPPQFSPEFAIPPKPLTQLAEIAAK